MTPKQQRFVDEYLIDLNATRAYLRVYSKCTEHAARKNAARLLTKDDIQQAIADGQQRLADKSETTALWVRRRLKELSEYTGEGTSHSARVRAVELIGKLNGDFIEKQKTDVDMRIIVEHVDGEIQDSVEGY